MWNKPKRNGNSVHRLFDGEHLSGRTLVGRTGRLGRLLFLSGVNMFPLDEEECSQVYRGLIGLLGQIPEGFGLQFRVETRHGRPGATPGIYPENLPAPEKMYSGVDETQALRAISEERIRDMESRPACRRRLILGIIGYPLEEKERFRLSFYPRSHVPALSRKSENGDWNLEQRLREIRTLEESIVSLLPGAGMEGKRPTEDEILCHLAERANPGLLVREVFRPDRRGPIPPLFQTSFQELAGELRAFRPDGSCRWGRFHALRQLPATFHRETLAPILESPDFDCDLTLNLFRPSRSLASRSIQSNATVNRFLTLLLPGTSYRLESVIAEQEAFLRAVHEGADEESAPWLANLTFGYWHFDRSVLSEMGMKALRCFGEADGALLALEPYRQWPLFRSQFLLDGDGNDRWEIMTSSQAARFVPVWDRFPDQDFPWFLAKNHRQEILGLNFWGGDLPNANGLVVGRSGSGKSFGVKLLLSQFMLADPRHQAIIVENGGDFERLTEFLGGDYVRIDLSGSFSLNPFPLRDVLLGPDGLYDPDWMGFLVALIETFLVSAHPVLPLHRKILEQCLGDMYDRLSDPAGRPCLTDLVRTLFSFRGRDNEDEEASLRMAKTLESWSTGLYGALFNNPQGFSPTSRILAFDLSGLDRQEALRGIVFAFIAGISMERLFRDKNRRLYFVYDEAHRLMTQFQGTGFLEHMYRTARKFGGGVIAMSQSPEDWIGDGREGGILGNSSWKWIFPCSVMPETYRKIGLSDREIAIIDSLDSVRGDFSECYLSMGTRRGILRLEPSPMEYVLSARSPEEDRMIDEVLKNSPDVFEGVLRLSSERWEEREAPA